MGKYLAYVEYEDSGIEWIGNIPAHWAIDRIRWSVTGCKNGIWGDEPDGEDDLVCIRVADFDRQSFIVETDKLTMRAIKPKDRRDRLLSKGDLLIEKSGGGEQQLVGAVVYFHHAFEAVTSNFVARMPVAEQMDGRFLTYAHAHLYAGRVNYRSVKQTTGIQNLDSQQYLDEKMAYPPLAEQQAIARFLDYKTTQIDALIAKKEALLAKLAEKRTALISHAVTKGLDPTVPMKDSGIEWLGEIPAHWKVLPLKYAITFQRGHDLPAERRVEGDVPLVSSSGVSSLHDEAKAKGPGIVTGRYGTIGKFTYIEEDYWPLNTTLYTINTHSNSVKYLWYMLHNLADLFILNSQKSAVPGVDRNDLHPILTVLPPRSEQDQIVEMLLKLTVKIDQQICKVNQAINKLKEYRTALITNAVTGKIDVRTLPIPAPTSAEAVYVS